MKSLLISFMSVVGLVALIGCGKSGGGSSNANNGTVTVCPAGAVNTQYGCLNQAGCPVGFGMYNNGQCVPQVAVNQCQAGFVSSTQYGCLQQGACPSGYGMYNNSCVIADGGINNQYQYNNGGYYNGGYNYTQQLNTGYYPNYGYNPYPSYGYGAGAGFNFGINFGAGAGFGYGQPRCGYYFGQYMCQ